MNNSRANILDIKCKNCEQPFSQNQQPKVLPCGHSICSICLFQDSQRSGYYFCPQCQYRYDSLNVTIPINQLFFEIMEKANNYIRNKQWQISNKQQNIDDPYFNRKDLLKIQQQCLYPFCQRKKYQRDNRIEMFCSQQCKNNYQQLEEV